MSAVGRTGIQYFEGKEVRVVFSRDWTDVASAFINNVNTTFTVTGYDDYGLNLVFGRDVKTTDDTPVIYVPWHAILSVFPARATEALRRTA
ncbi:MAG TPA: hypothetical protein VMZ26_11915 [Pyrinomonadaceae bacterium]|nr:hypothetical protein [Pyrinomonadaceae bacterium]